MILGLDTETAKILPGLLSPPLACLSAADDEGEFLYGRDDALARARGWLLDPHVVLAVHNATFDMGVLCAADASLIPLVFDAYRAHRIRCTIVRQKLMDIARGERKYRRSRVLVGGEERQVVTKSRYSLADLVALYFGERIDKKAEDGSAAAWRLSYALLADVSVAAWPASARDYAMKDAADHLRLYLVQEDAIAAEAEWGGVLPNQAEQQMAAWALHLMSMWGVRAEAAAVDRFVAHCEEEIAKMRSDLADTGIFREHGPRNMEEIRRRVVAACARKGVAVPMTDPSVTFPEGQVQVDKDALEATDDPALHVLASQMTFAKHLGQWGPVVRAAIHRPSCARYEVIVETGRTACSGSEGQEATNMMTPPRKGDVRPCFVPRLGWVLCSTDGDTVELRAHAQDCLELVGWSKMAEALWDQHRTGGADLHVRLAAAVLGISVAEAHARKQAGDAEVLAARQFVKILNFGYPGGLGAETMITYAAQQLDRETHKRWFGVDAKEQLDKSSRLRDIWFQTWPENRVYFKIVAAMVGDGGHGLVRQLMSGRLRGDVRFTAAANGFFQGRVADAFKEVLFHLADECYTGRCTTQHVHGGSALCTASGRSVLYGSRPAYFLHDEPIVEHPEDGSESDRAERQRQLVVAGLSRWMPSVPCTSAAVLMRRWTKGAEPVYVDGRLVPSKPEKVVGADGRTKVRWVHDAR